MQKEIIVMVVGDIFTFSFAKYISLTKYLFVNMENYVINYSSFVNKISIDQIGNILSLKVLLINIYFKLSFMLKESDRLNFTIYHIVSIIFLGNYFVLTFALIRSRYSIPTYNFIRIIL